MEGSFNKLDLSGKLIIKASFNEDIRRIPIHNDDLTYDELVLMMQRVFKGAIDPEEDLLLKYKDEDGDLITITDNSELSFAIQYCRVLKLTVLSSKHGEASPNLSGSALRELRSIRDSINKILDGAADAGGTSIANTEEPGESVSSTVAKEPNAAVNGFKESKEFDPLIQQPGDQASKQESDQQSISSHSSHQEVTEPGHYQATQQPAYAAPQPTQPPNQAPPAAGQYTQQQTAYNPSQPAGYPASYPTNPSPAPGQEQQQQPVQAPNPGQNLQQQGHVQQPGPAAQAAQMPNHSFQPIQQPAAAPQAPTAYPTGEQTGQYPASQRPAFPPTSQQQYHHQTFAAPSSGAPIAQPPASAYPPGYSGAPSGYPSGAGAGAYPGYQGYPTTSAPSNPYSRGPVAPGYSHPTQQTFK